jgi:hypothetical protein
LLAAAAVLLATRIPGYGEPAAHLIASICVFELKLVELPGLSDWLRPVLDAHPVLTAAFGGAYHGILASLFATRLHDHFFAAFNDDVLRRIKRPLAFDPLWGIAGTPEERAAAPIPWAQPDEPGTRKDA